MVSLFKNVNPYSKTNDYEIEKVLEAIKNPKQKTVEIVDTARKLKQKDEKQYANFKKSVPVVTYGGSFHERRKSSLIKPSGFIYFDVDPKQQQETIDVEKIKDKPYVHAIWNSIGGEGYAGLIKTSDDIDSYKYSKIYKQVQQLLRTEGIILDNVSDISRSNFISYDPDIYINPESIVYIPKIELEAKVKKQNYVITKKDKYYNELCCGIAFNYVTNKRGLLFINGQKHNFTMHYCSMVIAFGIDLNYAYNYLVSIGSYSNDTYKKMDKFYTDWSSTFDTMKPQIK